MAKNALITYYDCEEEGSINEDGKIKYYFKEMFNFIGQMEEEDLIEVFGVKDFEKLDIKTIVANMHYPYLTIYPENTTDALWISLDYVLSNLEHYYDMDMDMRLGVNMDKELNITGFMAILD